jgi:hypothetical protein
MLLVGIRGGGLPSRFIVLEEWNDGIVARPGATCMVAHGGYTLQRK